MKRKLLTVLLMSAMVLVGSTVVKADDESETNLETPIENTEIPDEKALSNEALDIKNDNTIAPHSGDIVIDEAHFPDEVFREYLKNSFDKNDDGYFSQDEIDSVTSIDMLYTGNGTIENLVGINHFKNLTCLNCSGKQLMEIDISQNPNLQTLDCHYNQIKSLDVSQNPNLATLNCGANQLTALDVSQNPNLVTLKCDNNHQIKLLDVSQNPNLQTLDCSYNQIVELDVSQNPNLIVLNCNNNQIKVLDVSQNPNLSTLYCDSNQITALDVDKNLSILWCTSNQLEELNVSQNANLKELCCGSNQLTTLDVSQNPNLETLRCEYSHITELNISKNPNLSTLFCDGNQIKSLDVSNNLNLSRLGCPVNQLKELNVSKNVNLKELGCGGNQITSLDVSQNTNLKRLLCNYNQLAELDVSKNVNLSELRCQNNHLTNLDLSYNENMPTRGDSIGVVVMGGAHVVPQIVTTSIAIINDTWTLDLAAIVGKENLNRVTLATDGAKLSADGTVTFSGSNMPTELVYNYDTKNPAEDTPMTVHVALTQKNVDDQTGEGVTVDTGGLDIDNICKENNINISANFEIILSQDTLSKESLDKLTQAAGTNGYSISATYEILMSLFSNGQKVKDITDNFGRIKLTFRLNASLAGQNAVVYQLHNDSQVIVHDGLTVNTDGTVTVTVDKFSAFAVAVKPSSNNTGKPDTGQSATNKPDSNRPGTNQPDTNKPDTNQPDSNKTDTNQPNINQPDAGQLNVKETNANQISPKTGDGVNPVFWIIVAMAASITGILSIKTLYKH